MLKVKIEHFSRTSRITMANCAQPRASYLKLCSKISEASENGKLLTKFLRGTFSILLLHAILHSETHSTHYRINLQNVTDSALAKDLSKRQQIFHRFLNQFRFAFSS